MVTDQGLLPMPARSRRPMPVNRIRLFFFADYAPSAPPLDALPRRLWRLVFLRSKSDRTDVRPGSQSVDDGCDTQTRSRYIAWLPKTTL